MNRYKMKYKTLDSFCKDFHAVEDLLKWYKANKVKWPKDRKNKDANDRPMSWPDNLLQTKVGLCFDHAIFLHYFCMKNHIEHRLLFIQGAVEVKDAIYCIGHAIGLYKSDNGVNFFDIQGEEIHSKELGPYHSFEEAIRKYVSLYSNMVSNSHFFNTNAYKIHKKPFYVVLDENQCSAMYDKYYNDPKITQNEIIDATTTPLMIKKYGSSYPFKYGAARMIERSFFDIAIHDIKQFISEYIGKPLFKLGLPNIESGLMGSTGGAVVGVYGTPFVSQIMSSTFVRPKYGVSNDIFTDNILTTNDNDTLEMMSSDYLKDKKVRVFKYKGKDGNKKLNKIFESVGQEVDRRFIYEAISDKHMYADDQICIDEDFEEIKFDELKAFIENEAYSVLNKYVNMNPTLASRYSVVNTLEASSKLNGHPDNVIIMENADLGYFACNRNTMRRTKYYSSISDIVIGSDIDGQD